MANSKKLQIAEENSKDLNQSPNSLTVKKERKRAPRTKKVIDKSKIWDNDDVLWVIFSFSDHKDLIKFNIVCKRWYHVSNPIVHKSIKLLRNVSIINKSHDKSLGKKGKIDAEVGECIENNTKYAHLVKECSYCEKIELHRTIQFFETFKYISQLALSFIDLSQDQFLSIISQLDRLKELSFEHVDIKYLARNSIYKNSIQLPSSLTKLSLKFVKLMNDPVLFFQTINSHTNLKELKFETYHEHGFLEHFCKGYPSLKTFEYINENDDYEISRQLLDTIQFNSQLTKLTLVLKWMDTELARHICRYLVNLEILNLFEYRRLDPPHSPLYLKFSQPINIKKLKLVWDKLTPCSIESIILNCPNLEDLELSFYRSYRKADPLLLNLSKSTKINKLKIKCDHLNESALDSILLNCPRLRELEVQIPKSWKEWINSIGSRCLSLEKLTLFPTNAIYLEERKLFLQELNEMKFLTNNPSYQSTLTNLTLHEFSLKSLNPEYISKFSMLQSIKFKWRISADRIHTTQINEYKGLLPNYEIRHFGDHKAFYDIEFFKI
jgi:hypothetical protein